MSETIPSNAMAVANWFIMRGKEDEQKPPIDQLKLYKLCYYAHAWYLGNELGSLFPEDVEAWPHGPVVSDLYIEFKKSGKSPISEPGLRLKSDGSGFEIPKHDGSLDDYFERIWEVYGGMTGIQLSNSTHGEEEPWYLVAKQYGFNLDEKPTIPNELIEKVFKDKLEEPSK